METIGKGLRDNFDWPLFVTVAAIAVIGVTNLYSATSAASAALSELYIQQIYWLTLGAGAAVLIVAIDYRYFERFGWVAYGAGIVLLVLVVLLAPEIRGAQRWIRIGSFSLQPSELMKMMREDHHGPEEFLRPLAALEAVRKKLGRAGASGRTGPELPEPPRRPEPPGRPGGRGWSSGDVLEKGGAGSSIFETLIGGCDLTPSQPRGSEGSAGSSFTTPCWV